MQILRDFGCSLGILFGIIFLKNEHLFQGLNFNAFLVRFYPPAAGGGPPGLGLSGTDNAIGLTRPAQALPGAAYMAGSVNRRNKESEIFKPNLSAVMCRGSFCSPSTGKR